VEGLGVQLGVEKELGDVGWIKGCFEKCGVGLRERVLVLVMEVW
jgi:hypothetical protein